MIPVLGELVSNGGDASNHGSAPRVSIIRPTAPRAVPGQDPDECRPSDLEMNSLVVGAGEAVKDQAAEPRYSIERRYREIELEVYYFNEQSRPPATATGRRAGDGAFRGCLSPRERADGGVGGPGDGRVGGVARGGGGERQPDGRGGARGVWSPVELVEDGGTWRGA